MKRTDQRKPHTRKSAYNFTITPERLAKMNAIREKIGIPIAEQIRRGVDLWLAQQEGEAK